MAWCSAVNSGRRCGGSQSARRGGSCSLRSNAQRRGIVCWRCFTRSTRTHSPRLQHAFTPTRENHPRWSRWTSRTTWCRQSQDASQGEQGQGGSDSISLQHWLLWFGLASGEFRLIVAEVGGWLSNERPPWAAYCALMSVRLIALDKSPGIRPVGIGETWRRLLAAPSCRLPWLPALTPAGGTWPAGVSMSLQSRPV